jgi:hypothetical protein
VKGFFAFLLERVAEQEDISLRGLDQGEQHPDGRALAGSVGAEEAKDVSAMDLEVQMVNSPALLVLFSEISRLEDDVASQENPRAEEEKFRAM